MIQDILDRLKANTTLFKAFLTAEDLDALSQGVKPAANSLFVLPYREEAEENTLVSGGFRQRVAVQILVAFFVRIHDDAKGGKRVSAFDAAKHEIEQALAGWSIDRGDDLFQLVSGRSAPLGNGTSVYVQTWQTSRTLRRS